MRTGYKSSTFDKLIEYYNLHSKMDEKYRGKSINTLKKLIEEPCYSVGKIRLLNEAEKRNLDLKPPKIRKVFDNLSTLDLQSIFKSICKYNNLDPNDEHLFLNKLESCSKKRLNGHDISEFIAKHLCPGLKPEKVEKDLVFFYSVENYKTTTLYRNISDWMSKNQFSLQL